MKRFVFVPAVALCSIAKAQSSYPNIGIGLNAPHFGVNIKTNFSAGTSGWARGYRISNQGNSYKFIMLGFFCGFNNGYYIIGL